MNFFEFYKKINELAPPQPNQVPQPNQQPQPNNPQQSQGTSPPVPAPDPHLAQALNSLNIATKANPNLKGAYDAFMKQLQATGVSLPGMTPAQPQPSMTQPQQPQAR